MSTIPDDLRSHVYDRADGICEYCLMGERYTMKLHEVDHIYAEKHGGKTILENLCLSCATCNRFKGSDLCSLDPLTGQISALYHPRRDIWSDHFRLKAFTIEPITPTGRVTVQLLKLNDFSRLAEREALFSVGRYPGHYRSSLDHDIGTDESTTDTLE
ncbi:MAG: HNH endonuclease [Anaerolineae bacterium]|nr:HNH endonuclease [Anaerolineae bacterium]